jgi:hypothetical protein
MVKAMSEAINTIHLIEKYGWGYEYSLKKVIPKFQVL